MTTSHKISWTDVAREAADGLGHLLALGPSSPPAWELPAARSLLGLFEREGIPALILPPQPVGKPLSPYRPNVVAHIPGSGAEEPLLLLSHLDSAPRHADEWAAPHDTEGRMLTGPGALAGVHLAIAQAMAMILIARSGAPLKRTVRYAATSEGAGGRGAGLQLLAGNHLEHITSDIAIGWDGVSWTAPDGAPCSLLSNADKGTLHLKLRSEGGGGSVGVRVGKDPVDALVTALERLGKIEFPLRVSSPSMMLAQSVAETIPDKGSRHNIEALSDHVKTREALSGIFDDPNLDIGLKALLKSSVSVEWGIVRLDASSGEGLRPRSAEAELVYTYPPGADVENLATRILEALGPDGVYLAEKSVQQPSESELTPEIEAMARVALTDIDPKSHLVVGLAPWATGLGALRHFGTSVFSWEPFANVGTLGETLSRRGGAGEMIEMGDLVREVRAIHSFLLRMAC